jgi:hypothetical protein
MARPLDANIDWKAKYNLMKKQYDEMCITCVEIKSALASTKDMYDMLARDNDALLIAFDSLTTSYGTLQQEHAALVHELSDKAAHIKSLERNVTRLKLSRRPG